MLSIRIRKDTNPLAGPYFVFGSQSRSRQNGQGNRLVFKHTKMDKRRKNQKKYRIKPYINNSCTVDSLKVLSQLSSFHRNRPLPWPACPVLYTDEFMEYYNADHSIKHFLTNKTKLSNFYNCLILPIMFFSP